MEVLAVVELVTIDVVQEERVIHLQLILLKELMEQLQVLPVQTHILVVVAVVEQVEQPLLKQDLELHLEELELMVVMVVPL